MIRIARSACWWVALFWVIPLVALGACLRLDASPLLTVPACIAVVTGIIQHIDAFARLGQWRQSLREAEEASEAEMSDRRSGNQE